MLINAINSGRTDSRGPSYTAKPPPGNAEEFDFNALACNRTRFGLQIKRSDAFSVPKLPVIDFIPSCLRA